jgi:hypothetical protein
MLGLMQHVFFIEGPFDINLMGPLMLHVPVPRWLLAAVLFVIVLLATFELAARFALVAAIISTLTSVI